MSMHQAVRMGVGVVGLATLLASVAVSAHPMTHQGTVLAVEPTRLQVKTVDDTSKKEDTVWFTVNKATKVKRGDKTVTYTDAKIVKGERIVITVDTDAKTKMLATEIRLASAPPPSGQASPQALGTIVVTTTPAPAVTGDNRFEVTAKRLDGTPVVGADVSILLIMPAMPAMGMSEMKTTVALQPAEGKAAADGKYVGHGRLGMAGKWNATVTVKVDGKDFAQKTTVVVAK